MKYQIDDIVKIRTWEDMKKEYGLNYRLHSDGAISFHEINENKDIFNQVVFTKEMEKDINQNYPNRIFTIATIKNHIWKSYYEMKEITWMWNDYMIECFAENYVEPEPIYSRFEILDL